MDLNDYDIVARIRRRDPEGLEALMNAYGKRVYGLVSRMLFGSFRKEDVEECASDVFIAAWHKIDEFDPAESPFRTWLYMLAKYKTLDYRRKCSVRPHFASLPPDMEDATNTEQDVVKKEEADELIRAIDLLDDIDRAIVYKRYYFYESTDSIAKDLGLTPKAVENRLRRARAKLKGRLIDYNREVSL